MIKPSKPKKREKQCVSYSNTGLFVLSNLKRVLSFILKFLVIWINVAHCFHVIAPINICQKQNHKLIKGLKEKSKKENKYVNKMTEGYTKVLNLWEYLGIRMEYLWLYFSKNDKYIPHSNTQILFNFCKFKLLVKLFCYHSSAKWITITTGCRIK